NQAARLDTAFSLNHQDPGLSDGMGDVLGPDSGMEDVARLEDGAVLQAGLPVTHLDPPIEDGKHLLAVVDVPLVGLVRPVKARGDPAHVGNVCRAPRTVCLEGAAAEDFHAVSKAWVKPTDEAAGTSYAEVDALWSSARGFECRWRLVSVGRV